MHLKVRFYFFRIYILSVFGYDYVFLSSRYKHITVLIYIPEISRMVPSVPQNFSGFILHFIITVHYIIALKAKFSNAFSVRIMHLAFYERKYLSCSALIRKYVGI